MSAEYIRWLCRVPDVSRADPRDEAAQYAPLIAKLRAEARTLHRKVGAPRLKKCGNPNCPLPGGMFGPRHNEHYTQYRHRQFCCHRCAQVIKNGRIKAANEALVPQTDKRCGHCRKLLTRRDGEERRKWLARQYCNRQCQWAAQRGRPKAARK